MLSELDIWMDDAKNTLQLILDNMDIAYKALKKDKELMKAHKKDMDVLDNAMDELDDFINAEIVDEDEDTEEEK